jgi:hypothetical protein
MSIASLNTSPSAGTSGRTELSEHAARTQAAAATSTGTGSTLAGVAAGVSATVAFSGEALQALERAGEFVVGGAEDLALGAWHGLEAAEHGGAAVVDAVETGANKIAGLAVAAGKQLAHYAAVGAHATGEAVSDVASGTVMAASAAGKTILSLV